ncbi:hypothetical protein DPX16_5845 [Anabarilius grahami]|uniref:Uncharacterized protein n=1 Tax=Anabarilius grahami TaxID=495550 RepID=A0A3N0YV49_ANAGA|nr:hypothetical protein DPX16_5845 [Anabarilius grahami]
MENISCFSVAARALRIGAYGFINKAQFYAGFTDRLKLKDGAVTAVMIPVMSRNRRWTNTRSWRLEIGDLEIGDLGEETNSR